MKRHCLVIILFVFSLLGTPVLSLLGDTMSATVSAATPQRKTTAKKATNPKQPVKKKQSRNNNVRKAPAKKSKTVAKQQTKKNTKTAVPAKTPEQEALDYREQVAKVERYNAKVAAYMTRDISHRVGLWGQIGYSAIVPRSFTYEAETPLGFLPKTIGGVGGGAGLGYQLQYKRFLFTTGAEWQMYNSHTQLGNIVRTFPVKQYETMTYAYDYTMQDYWQAGYIQIPLMFGMELPDWYWQLGGKVGLNVMGTSRLSGLLTTKITDKELIDDLQNMYSHALVNNYDFNADKQVQPVRFGFNAAIAAEIGISLDRWLQPQIKSKRKMTDAQRFARSMHYRVALFAEYGVLNINNVANIKDNASDIPADFTSVLNGQPLAAPSDLYNKVTYGSSLSTESARKAYLNPLLVGVKVTMFYELPRKDKKMLSLPAEPKPRFLALVTNAETGKAIAGAQVSILDTASDKVTNKASNSKGMAQTRLPKGTYRVAVAKSGFLPCDTIENYRHHRDLGDTLKFQLHPLPQPVVYTLCGYALDADTKQVLEADIRIAASADTTILYHGATNDEGLFVSDLEAGQYTINAICPGYMPLLQDVSFNQDTVTLLLQRIKEGVKVKINHLYFATNKTTILPESEEALSDLADFLHDNPSVSIRITGHTDAIGSDAANLRLSIGRAKAVRTNLIMRGIDADRIEFDGKGETEPIATNDTEEGRAQNRRVEFEILSTNGENIQQVY